jgi:hypothetical protein
VTQGSRAAAALEGVLKRVEPPRTVNGNLRILGAWTEGPETICIIYEGWWHPGTIGLRREIESDWPLESVVLNILTADLGEPIGPSVDTDPDEHGVTWWTGAPPQWRVRY